MTDDQSRALMEFASRRIIINLFCPSSGNINILYSYYNLKIIYENINMLL